jgi:pumilio RNA-binding family
MTAAAPYHNLCAALVHRFLSEGVMEHANGDQLLRHCFATMPYQHTMVRQTHYSFRSKLLHLGKMLHEI